jgi:DNA-binding FadR family transcriptional regulator
MILNHDKQTFGRRPLGTQTRIPESIRHLDFDSLAALVQALCTEEADAVLQACRAHLQASRCTPCALRQSTARLRLYLSRHPPLSH